MLATALGAASSLLPENVLFLECRQCLQCRPVSKGRVAIFLCIFSKYLIYSRGGTDGRALNLSLYIVLFADGPSGHLFSFLFFFAVSGLEKVRIPTVRMLNISSCHYY